MKKVRGLNLAVTIALMFALALGACASGETQSSAKSAETEDTETAGEAESSVGGTETVQDTENATDGTEAVAETELLPANEAFARVLRNEMACTCTENKTFRENEAVFYTYECCLNEVPIGDGTPLSASEFAVVDMDGNGVPEIVLAIDDYYGFVILRYVKGEIWGNVIGYRKMYNLRANGMCHSSGGSEYYSEITLFFIGDAYFKTDLIKKESENYYINGIPVSEDEWEEAETWYNELPFAEWHAYTGDSIEAYVAENEELSGVTPSFLDARQEYLDGWSGLLAMTYDEAADERDAADARAFYYACDGELKKIVGLCAESLEEDEAKQLQAEYSEWRDAYDTYVAAELLKSYPEARIEWCGDKSQIYSYGGILLERAYYYVDLYFNGAGEK